MTSPTWTTRDGTTLKIADMTDSHLLNAASVVFKRGKAGELVAFIGGGYDSEDLWGEEIPVPLAGYQTWLDLTAELRARRLPVPGDQSCT